MAKANQEKQQEVQTLVVKEVTALKTKATRAHKASLDAISRNIAANTVKLVARYSSLSEMAKKTKVSTRTLGRLGAAHSLHRKGYVPTLNVMARLANVAGVELGTYMFDRI